MKKVLLFAGFAGLMLLAAGTVRAVQGVDCSQALNDQTGKLSPAVVQPELSKLQAEGVDAKVLVVGPTSNLDFDEQAVERSCMEWRSPGGGRKSTLLVLGVSPEGRKAGVYYGRALEHALAGQWPRILHDYMAPSFKQGDWNAGVSLGLQQLSARIVASRSEALTPAVTTVNNQATDLSGLWSVLGWLVLFGVLGVIGYALYAYFKRRAEAADTVGTAQAQALRLKNTAAALINEMRDRGQVGGDFERASEDFARLAQSFQTDPETPNLTVAQYQIMGEGYADVIRTLRAPGAMDTAPARHSSLGGHVHTAHRNGHRRHGQVVDPSPTVVAANPGTSIFAPVIINSESSYRDDNRDESSGSSSSSSSSSSDDGGSVDFGSSSSSSSSDDGGSSSWSSDSSSSSFDSGGSSSFDSGSSFGGDSGGGSSDF